MGNLTQQDFLHLLNLGLKPIPLIWDTEAKSATSHCIPHSEVTVENYTDKTFNKQVKSLSGVNGIAIKLFAPFGCIDFDLKNTEDKKIFDAWLFAVSALDDEILRKICIETTRNAGFHVYIKYSKLSSKLNLAREIDGEEVIALYTGGTLSYCDPTPGYTMYHNTFEDLEELTDDEYDVLISTAISFDKYVSKVGDNKENKPVITEYPKQHENVCLQFDTGITDDAFELLLNEIGLFRVLDYKYGKKDFFIAYLREGSKAKYSAKVYFKSKKLLIFSGSITGFPHWADRKDKDDHSWVITPSKLIYYKNDCEWTTTMDEISLIADSIGLDISEQPVLKPDTNLAVGTLKIPMDVFTEEFQDLANLLPFPNEMMAAAFLSTVSVLMGNSCVFVANPGFNVKPILFMAVVASPGSSKSPAAKVSLSYLDQIDKVYLEIYQAKLSIYKAELAEYKNQKKGDGIPEPVKPELQQLQIKDATIEMTIKILSTNTHGCINNSDELSGFLKRMSRYGDNDETQKWLQLYDALPLTLQRIGRELDSVSDPFCSIFGTIQPGVLPALSANDNQHNGFFHRFLFVYPDPEDKPDFLSYTIPEDVSSRFKTVLDEIYLKRDDRVYYHFSAPALEVYKKWFAEKNKKYNAADSDDVKGIISKYQTYCLKFALILEVMHNRQRSEQTVSEVSMERAIRLTEYFLVNISKAMKILVPETPVDKLTGNSLKLYNALPATFTNETAIKTAKAVGIKEGTCRVNLVRWCEKDSALLTSTGTQREKVYSKVYD